MLDDEGMGAIHLAEHYGWITYLIVPPCPIQKAGHLFNKELNAEMDDKDWEFIVKKQVEYEESSEAQHEHYCQYLLRGKAGPIFHSNWPLIKPGFS